MKGKLHKTQQGWWDVEYLGHPVNVLKGYEDLVNYLPLRPEDIDSYLFELEQGKEVEFEIDESTKHAKLFLSDVKKDALDFLANQAQELNLGYEVEWDEFFENSEKVLKFELPLRYKNWLRNTYKNPQTL